MQAILRIGLFITPIREHRRGGIISPILANIYLDKFDKYVNEYVRKFKKVKSVCVQKRVPQERSRIKQSQNRIEKMQTTTVKEEMRLHA